MKFFAFLPESLSIQNIHFCFSSTSNKDEPGTKFNTIMEMCQMCDLDRLLQGLYENCLYVRFRDSYFEAVNISV